MSDASRDVKLGLFVVTGVALAAIGAVLLGGGDFLKSGLPFETRVSESIQGLNVGAPVKLLGVTVGRVTKIGLVAAEGEPVVRVVGELDIDDLPSSWRPAPEESLRREVRQGLRARLASVGLSGQLYVELEDVADVPAPPDVEEDRPVLVPSVPSVQRRLVRTAQSAITKLAELDLARLTLRLEEVLEALDRLIKEEAAPALREVARAAAEVRRSAGPELRDTLAALPAVLARLEETLAQVGRLAGAQEADLRRSMENVRGITEDLKRLSTRAEQDPGGVLFGGPPRAVEPGRPR